MADTSEADEIPKVDVKEAIHIAKSTLMELLDGEQYSQVGLEEVQYIPQEGGWVITVGYNRPWDVEKKSVAPSLGSLFPNGAVTTTSNIRTFKKIKINVATGKFLSMTDG